MFFSSFLFFLVLPSRVGWSVSRYKIRLRYVAIGFITLFWSKNKRSVQSEVYSLWSASCCTPCHLGLWRHQNFFVSCYEGSSTRREGRRIHSQEGSARRSQEGSKSRRGKESATCLIVTCILSIGLIIFFVSISDCFSGLSWFIPSSSGQARCQIHAAWPNTTTMEVHCFTVTTSYKSCRWSPCSRWSSH